MPSRKKRIRLECRDDVTVLDLGPMEIWDGADLALLRETLIHLTAEEGCRAIGVDLTFVKYIPSGFFGMLFDLHEDGTAVRVYSPQQNVSRMLWFRQFFHQVNETTFSLEREPKYEMKPPAPRKVWQDTEWSSRHRNGDSQKRVEPTSSYSSTPSRN